MKIHREGYKIIAATLIFIGFLALGIDRFVPIENVRYLLYLALAAEFFWTIYFFRVPNRTVNHNENTVLSSADGKIVAIEEVVEDEYFKTSCTMVSVFMSPFNVHVNWYPIDGAVTYTQYHPGKYLAAYNPKSSTLNERNTVVVTNKHGQSVLMRQIAGVMARRIISYAKPGDRAKQGAEFGIIRFGSRVDFYLPKEAEIKVKLGDKVVAKKSVIATL